MPDLWDDAIKFVLDYEGRTFENDPADPGGGTKFGISSKAYPDLDIINLTESQAKEIYRRDYWDACRCGEMPPKMGFAVFDCAVNQGVPKAKRLLQTSLGITPDGVLGPKTMFAVSKAGTNQMKSFLARRLDSYMEIIANNQRLRVFGFNWSYRVIKLAEILFKQ